MRVLSVRNPWALSMFVLGKDIENRSRPTRHRGPLLIHASAGLVRSTLELFERHTTSKGIDISALGEIEATCGGIIGIVDVTDCVASSTSPWFMGPYGYVLENPRRIPFHPCRGQVSMWHSPEDLCLGEAA